MCQRKIQFQCVSGHYGFITSNKFQAAVLLINIQPLCVFYKGTKRIALPSISICSSRVSVVSAKALDSGECLNDPHNIDISPVCVALFFSLFKSLLVCVLKWMRMSQSVGVAGGEENARWNLRSDKNGGYAF